MSEDATTPDLVALTRRVFEAVNHRDLDTAMGFYAPDAVWEASGMGTIFEGVTSIRGLYEDWIGAYEDWAIDPQEILDLGNGVVLAVNEQKGRLAGGAGEVRLRQGTISIWVEGVISRIANYGDVDEARAAAQRLAEELG